MTMAFANRIRVRIVLLSVATFLLRVSAEDFEAVKDEKMSQGIALALMFAMIFMFLLLSCTKHHDADMQKYTYMVINTTISIFCSVLMFQCLDHLYKEALRRLGIIHFTPVDCSNLSEIECDEAKTSANEEMLLSMNSIIANFAQSIFWYILLQVVLAVLSGAFKDFFGEPHKALADKVAQAEQEGNQKDKRRFLKRQMEKIKVDLECWGVLITHISGFASINTWASLQNVPPFNSTWYTSMLTLPISFVTQFVLQRLADFSRDKLSNRVNGKTDRFGLCWDETCEDMENEIMGLTLSFQLSQVLRFLISGKQPNPEGRDRKWSDGYSHSVQETLVYLGCVIVFAGMVFLMYVLIDLWYKGEGDSESGSEVDCFLQGFERIDDPLLAAEHGARSGHHQHEGVVNEDAGCSPMSDVDLHPTLVVKGWFDELKMRLAFSFLVAMSMSFAWTGFYSGNWFIAAVFKDMIRHEQSVMFLRLIAGFILTLVAFAGIRVLDMIADVDFFPNNESLEKRVDEATKQLISSLGILVGFGWEQSFDVAIEELANWSEKPIITQLVLTTLCWIIILPYWWVHLLPFVENPLLVNPQQLEMLARDPHILFKVDDDSKVARAMNSATHGDKERIDPALLDGALASFEKSLRDHESTLNKLDLARSTSTMK